MNSARYTRIRNVAAILAVSFIKGRMRKDAQQQFDAGEISEAMVSQFMTMRVGLLDPKLTATEAGAAFVHALAEAKASGSTPS